ncbi:O-antigen ligase family protein [Rheinheimera sp.]|uniref:O-antigen ligase family protein n=1 Tax=Rheinheimera sp. TaxID=1869214 RepID=UPI0027369F06|nr:O-antigen ligase family protein [Rheinheimera sp.]MDP2715736.1 O-antigen ligase family protein [Rheinheimera sp.]
MPPLLLTTRLQSSIDKLLCYLIPLFLAVDCLNGALLQWHGSSYGLSIGYKFVVLLLMALTLLLQQPRLVFALLALLLLLLAGPAMHWSGIATRWMLADIQLAVKVLSPLLALAFLLSLQQRQPALAKRLLKQTLYISALVLLLNVLAGAAGLGFTAYQPLDGVAQSFLGIKGFFYSTNELSAVLLVISCGLLVLSWPQHKAAYALISACALVLAVLLLTKTGLFGVLVLVMLVPLLMQPAAFWQRQRRVIAIMAALLLLLLILLLLNGENLLRLLGIYDKLSFVYQQRGISGILLSSRDYYAGRIWQTAAEHYSDWQRFGGVGQGGIALYLKKYFAELDWFDLLVFHGIAGLLLFILVFTVFIRHSWQLRASGAGRSLLLLNLLLLLVSSLAGHILTSGMLWLPWALCNALLWQSAAGKRSADERHS